MKEKLLPGLNVTLSQAKEIRERVRLVVLDRIQQDHSWVEDYLPLVLPAGWEVRQRHPVGGMVAVHYAGLSVIMSGSVEDDSRRWIHLSCGRQKRLPNWDDLKLVKQLFLGDRWAIQVLPKAEKYVNINPFVLHLWHCADEFALPDFTGGTGSI